MKILITILIIILSNIIMPGGLTLVEAIRAGFSGVISYWLVTHYWNIKDKF